MHTLWLIMTAVLALCWGVAGSAAAGEVDDAIAAAMDDVEAGRCDQVSTDLLAHPALESRARLLAGQCRISVGLYPEALNDLNRIRGAADLTPEQVGNVELYRAVAFYHLERYTEASAALGRAEGLTDEEAQLALYRGLLALRDGDSDRAAPSLESAARLAPAMTEPVASYYAGLAWQGSAERTKARTAFQRVVDLDGDGPWGKEAAKMLKGTSRFPFYVNARVGAEFDTNVLLRGGIAQSDVNGDRFGRGDQDDWRGVWRIHAGVQLFEFDEWSGGVTGGYSGTAQHELRTFDTHYPTIGAYVANEVDSNTSAQARYQYGFAWVNEKSFLQTQVAELSLSHIWPKAGTTVALVDVIVNDLRFSPNAVIEATAPGGVCPVGTTSSGCGPVGLNARRERDRDGVGIGGALQHRYPIRISSGLNEIFKAVGVEAGYRFRYFHADGDEWKHFSHVFSAGVNIALPHAFSVTTSASYEFRDFLNPSTYPDLEVIGQLFALSGKDRQEHEVQLEAEVEKALNDNLSVSARYAYLNNTSNRRVFDYTRHVVGGYVNFRFQ